MYQLVDSHHPNSRLLQQKTMIRIENTIVAGDALLWVLGNYYDSIESIGDDRRKARQRECAAIRAGSKIVV